MIPVIEIKNLTTVFDTFEHSVTAIDQINLNLNEGEMLGIVGGTGSGKSVLLKSILNLVPFPGRITSGEVLYGDKNILEASEDELRAIRGQDISLILPNPRTALNPLQTIGDQIANALISHTKIEKEEALDKALQMLQKVGISDPLRRLNAYPHELSGGMCQRVLIGIALINSPKVLLADEISSGLDVTVQRQVLDLLTNLIKDYKSSTMIVTRDFGVVANYCQRVAVMYDGRIVEMDRVQYFFDRASHPVSLQLLRSTFAAKGRRGEDEKAVDEVKDLAHSAVGELKEIEPGHYIRAGV